MIISYITMHGEYNVKCLKMFWRNLIAGGQNFCLKVIFSKFQQTINQIQGVIY
jgi:hypothetical protein